MTNIYGGISMLKNRTLIGIILIAAAIGLCFGISPLFNSILSSKTKIIRLRQDIPQGVQITGAMLEAVEVACERTFRKAPAGRYYPDRFR